MKAIMNPINTLLLHTPNGVHLSKEDTLRAAKFAYPMITNLAIVKGFRFMLHVCVTGSLIIGIDSVRNLINLIE